MSAAAGIASIAKLEATFLELEKSVNNQAKHLPQVPDSMLWSLRKSLPQSMVNLATQRQEIDKLRRVLFALHPNPKSQAYQSDLDRWVRLHQTHVKLVGTACAYETMLKYKSMERGEVSREQFMQTSREIIKKQIALLGPNFFLLSSRA